MPQSLSNTIVHIIFSTKNRIKFIDETIENRLFSRIGAICKNLKCYPLKIGGYFDHVHILCKLHRPVSQSELVKTIKNSTSGWMKEQGSQYHNFYWQDGYAIYSVSPSEVDRILQYIANQKIHHAKKSFKSEYLDFLHQYNIEYDLKYVWD
jgi:REP element-mobilizing transposase RayT